MRASVPSRPPGVAFLQARLGYGGAERLIQELVRRLPGPDLRTLLFTLKDPGPLGSELAAAGAQVVSGLAPGRLDPGAGRRLAAACREHEIGAVYVTDSALPLFRAGELRRRPGAPRVAVGFHSTGARGGGLQHALARAHAIPVADALVALAPGHRDFLARELRVPPGRFTVIPNGVDTERFAPPVDRAATRGRLGLPSEAPVTAIVAALRPEKNHPLFLRVAAALAPRFPRASFLVVGDGPERARLERQAAGNPAVRFLGARNDVPDLVGASDVIVLCSHAVVETFPLSLIEALACGTPVVSTRVGSIGDIVVPGTTGELVDPGDERGFAEALAGLLADPARRARMGAAARADALARFRLGTMVDAYRRLFAGLVAGGAARGA